MTNLERVKKVATRAGAMAKTGELRRIDSVGMIDLIAGLEREFAVVVPATELKPERFASLNSLVELVEAIQAAQTAPK